MPKIERTLTNSALGLCVVAAVATFCISAWVDGRLSMSSHSLGECAWAAAPYSGFGLLIWLTRRNRMASAIAFSATVVAAGLGSVAYFKTLGSNPDLELKQKFFTVPLYQWCGCALLVVILLCVQFVFKSAQRPVVPGHPLSKVERALTYSALGVCFVAAVSAFCAVAWVDTSAWFGAHEFWNHSVACAFGSAPYSGFALLTWLSRHNKVATAISFGVTVIAAGLGSVVYFGDVAFNRISREDWDFFLVTIVQWYGCALLAVILLFVWILSGFAQRSRRRASAG